MAKTKPDTAAGEATTPGPDASDVRELAAKAIRAITGCGRPAAQRRMEALGAKLVNQIADLERKNQRHRIPPLLSGGAPQAEKPESPTTTAATEPIPAEK